MIKLYNYTMYALGIITIAIMLLAFPTLWNQLEQKQATWNATHFNINIAKSE